MGQDEPVSVHFVPAGNSPAALIALMRRANARGSASEATWTIYPVSHSISTRDGAIGARFSAGVAGDGEPLAVAVGIVVVTDARVTMRGSTLSAEVLPAEVLPAEVLPAGVLPAEVLPGEVLPGGADGVRLDVEFDSAELELFGGTDGSAPVVPPPRPKS